MQICIDEPDCRHTVVLSHGVNEEVMIISRVSIRAFLADPGAMFARVERGEQLEVTRDGEVIAILVAPPRTRSRHDELVARGTVRPATKNLTAEQWDEFTHIDVPEDVDPVAMLLEMREHER